MLGTVLIATAALLTPHQLHVLHVEHMQHLRDIAAQTYTVAQDGDGDHDADDGAYYAPNRAQSHAQVTGGTLGCAGLESLWESAGGSHSAAFVAAEVAIAESGGNQYATGPNLERGYWQINPDHGSLSTYNAVGNALAAIAISNDGTNWSPWTTYTSGAYIGRCLYAGRDNRTYVRN